MFASKNYAKHPENASVYEHFCRNDYTRIPRVPKTASLLMRACFVVWSHLFLFAFFGAKAVHFAFHFLFLQKEKVKESNKYLKQKESF